MFPQERYFAPTTYYLVPITHYIIPPDIILFPPERYFVPTRKIFCFPEHILGQAHTNTAGLNKFCESSCLHLFKHRTTDKRQIQNKRRSESRKYRAFIYMCVCACLCETEKEREREFAVCGVKLNAIVAFSVWLLYYVPYIFMFILPLVKVMGEGLRSHKVCSTPPCRCPKLGASSTLSES